MKDTERPSLDAAIYGTLLTAQLLDPTSVTTEPHRFINPMKYIITALSPYLFNTGHTFTKSSKINRSKALHTVAMTHCIDFCKNKHKCIRQYTNHIRYSYRNQKSHGNTSVLLICCTPYITGTNDQVQIEWLI